MQLVIVTGLSGAGKSVALDSLEDLGYYCIDNMPSALIHDFIDLIKDSKKDVDKAAICVDARTSQLYVGLEEQVKCLKGIDLRILFLEASDEALIRRYKETRRNHPLSKESIKDGIKKDKKLLSSARRIADNIIDTSNMKAAQLKNVIKDIVLSEEEKATFIINVSSFGYKHGMANEADLVFDMRFLPNPFYITELKPLTGQDSKVAEYVLESEPAINFIEKIIPLVEYMIPFYEKEGKFSLNIAFGCTGGQHRSVAMANEISRILKEKGYKVILDHRDI